MKTLKLFLSTVITCIFLIPVLAVHAQNTATVQATATVLDPITITSSTGINFGDEILPGFSQSISRSESNAAKFSLTGVGGNNVSINFTLPEFLIHELTGDEMPISFGPSDAGISIHDDISTSSAFNPNIETTERISGTGNDLFIWLGGSINPHGDQTAGTYSGDITIDVIYTES